MRLLGMIHILLNRIPLFGTALARFLGRCIAIFPWLGGVRGSTSIIETRQQLMDAGDLMNFPFEFGEIEGDRFVLELPRCPYGFHREEHRAACDTAMEMDRILLKWAGADLIITDTIPRGECRCRMIVHQPDIH